MINSLRPYLLIKGFKIFNLNSKCDKKYLGNPNYDRLVYKDKTVIYLPNNKGVKSTCKQQPNG